MDLTSINGLIEKLLNKRTWTIETNRINHTTEEFSLLGFNTAYSWLKEKCK